MVPFYLQPISLLYKQYFQFWVLFCKRDKGEKNKNAEVLQVMSHVESLEKLRKKTQRNTSAALR